MAQNGKGYLKIGGDFQVALIRGWLLYSELNLNQDKAASRRQYTRYGKASQRCTGLNLIHYSCSFFTAARARARL